MDPAKSVSPTKSCRPCCPLEADLQADAPRTVARRVMYTRLVSTEPVHGAGGIEEVDRRRRFDAQPKQETLLNRTFVRKVVVGVQTDRRSNRFFRTLHTGDVVDVRVSQQDVSNSELLAENDIKQERDLIARIDNDAVTTLFTRQDETVLEERLDCACFKEHRAQLPHGPGRSPQEALSGVADAKML